MMRFINTQSQARIVLAVPRSFFTKEEGGQAEVVEGRSYRKSAEMRDLGRGGSFFRFA